MIDVYAPERAFSKDHLSEVLKRLTECLLRWTDATDIPIARDNAGAYLHVLPAACITAGGKPARVVRIDVRVPEVVLSTTERRTGFVADATEIVNALSADGYEIERTLVTISNTVDGGWGMNGRALTNADLDDL